MVKMENVKEKAKVAVMCALPVVASGAYAITSFAAEDGTTSLTDQASESLLTAVTSMADSIGSTISNIVPIAVPLVGVGLVVTIGISVFKKISAKA